MVGLKTTSTETNPPTSFARRYPLAARLLRVFLVLFTLGLLGYIGAGIYFYTRQYAMVFRAVARGERARRQVMPPLGASYVTFPAARGETITALFGPALDEHGDRVLPDAARHPTLLFFYGVGEYLNYPFLRSQVEVFRRAGFNVLVPEYIGLGLSSGEPSEQGLYDTALAAYEHLRQRPDVDPQRIFIAGHSLGGAPAVDLAARVMPAGLMTLATFTSLPDIAALRYPMFPCHYLTRVRCPNIEKIRQVRAPILILHAENDTTVPLWMAEALTRAAFEGGNRHVVHITLPGGNHDTTFALPHGEAIHAMQAFAGIAPVPPEKVRPETPQPAQAAGGVGSTPSAAVRNIAVGTTTAATMNRQ
ncbi:prolyl oligopeptidase family serine peptidase [Chloracidobacterium sp. MS 40/45]|uniref:alpha/beta hydrolase n=1 Tax=Chloracidobacterium aggregatum TaxID=2851959 RepID=UPI001B8ADA67|nr:alpha/beta fold hydrolase [Chloracidobacterium aggregatum]QUW01781.1 prolyl oligopeptidase family serine peptidase [Chloracidobacterium sp. MS 40/45]